MQIVLTIVLLLFLFATPAGTAVETGPAGSSGASSGAASSPAASLKEFQPSTRLPVDEAIAFPVDI